MSPGERTRVFLTVDVECAEERVRDGTVHPPLGYDLRIWGRFENQREELGVPLLLRELRAAGLPATFFVEALGAPYFGEAELARLCAELRTAGQDVQLHVHPVQRCPDWHSRGAPREPDDIGAYDLERQVALLREGLERLEAAGVPRTSLLGFRAGNYGASNETWRALERVGLRLSSSFNLSYLDKSCRMRRPDAANALFDTGVPGVWELPVSNFREGGGRYRHVQITAVSFPEIVHYLREARRLGVPEVTIVTHSFEYFFVDSRTPARGRPNRVNVERLRALLAFLRENADAFQVDTIGALAASLPLPGGGAAHPVDAVPAGRSSLRWRRHLEQARKRLAAHAAPFA